MSASEIQRIRNWEHFDAEWYLKEYPDVGMLGMDPAEHYLLIGQRLDRKPSRDFDPSRLRTKNGNASINSLQRSAANGQTAHMPTNTQPAIIQKSLATKPPPGNGTAKPAARKAKASESVPVRRKAESGRVPHYGRVMHDLVEAAEARMAPEGVSKEYDTVRRHFDTAFYLTKYRDIARAKKIDPVQHYIRNGAREERDPTPYFSTKRYLERYPDVKSSGINPFYHWLTIGRAEGRVGAPYDEFESMCEIIGRSPRAVEDLLIAKRADLRERFESGALGEMVRKAIDLEPLIGQCWGEALQAKLPPFHSDAATRQVSALYQAQECAEFRRAKIVIAVNRPRWGGGRRMEGHISHALAGQYGADEIVVVYTDKHGEVPPNRYPDGTRHVDFAGIASRMHEGQRQRILVEFIRSLRPVALFNINSALLWDSMTTYGKALGHSVAIYGCLFCNEQNIFGQWGGYPASQFYRHFDVLSGVFTDSQYLVEQLSTQFQIPPGQAYKLKALEAPVDPQIRMVQKKSSGGRPQIFWSGRFDRQKRVDVAFEIAALVPEADFRFWGEAVVDKHFHDLVPPPNVKFEGVYEDFADLPMDQCDAWLYTSEWDGVPSLLIEVSMTGVPIVGSLAGGTGEILRDELSWPVAEIDNAEEYAKQIREILAKPEEMRQRARDLREYLISRRTRAAYLDTLMSALSRLNKDD